jgi:formylglycine-generating enzyme required for sulfatase activity
MVLTSGMVISATAGILPEDGDARYELVFWESIKNSQRAADYEAYLEAFPNGRFAPLAKARAAYLRKKEKSPPQPSISKAPRIKEIDAQYEVVKTANLRKAPDTNSAPVGVLKGGARVRATGRVLDSDWYRVESNGTTGFIYGGLIRKAASSVAPPRPIAPQEPVRPPVPVSTPAPTATQSSAILGELKAFKDCNECPEMISLPPGSFVMGDDQGDKSERPAHRVSISQPFAIGKYEVTVGQWNACVGTGGCSYRARKSGSDENMPVRDVSWVDAQEYVKWLSERTGESYRLPSEAEWEYAVRGNTSTRYWWGNRFDEGKASCKKCGGPWDRKSPKAVGSFAPNPFGLYDMNGNVWEWVSDCWHNSYAGAPRSGESWQAKNCRVRVLRGGSWRNDSNYMYSAVRFKYDADVRYLVNGFRVVKTLK